MIGFFLQPFWRTLIGGAEALEVHFPPDLQEKLKQSAAKQGRDADELVQEVLARYLADEERGAAVSHIEEGFLQAERGELTSGAQARREMQG